MLARAFRWVVGLPIVIIVVAFAVANRQWITVSFDPFTRDAPFASAAMPLWALFFFGLFFGLFAGWIACWFGQAKWRKAAKDARRDLAYAQAETSELRRELVVPPDSML